MKKSNTRLFLGIIIALVIGLFFGKQFFAAAPKNNLNSISVNETQQSSNSNDVAYAQRNNRNIANEPIPQKAISVLNYIKTHNKPMQNYVGGRVFSNRERRLPKADDGKPIQYQEWDINPKIKGQNRGAERIVTGSDGRAWYTKDHYKSFIEIK